MPDRPLRVAILARSVHPLHGVGGLERHVYDLVRHLVAEDAHVTLITKPPTAPPPDVPAQAATSSAAPEVTADPEAADPEAADLSAAHLSAGSLGADHRGIDHRGVDHRGAGHLSSGHLEAAYPNAAALFGVPHTRFRLLTVPYVTFPGAGRRGTTVVDRATAYPVFGWRAGRVAVKLARRGEVDIVHALGASGLGYAHARRRHEPTVPFVFNPQGLEEFGATDPGRARLKRAAYVPLQIAVRACARAADVVLATDRALVPTVLRHLPVDAARVTVIPNAIDLVAVDRWRTQVVHAGAGLALRARLGLEPETPVLLSVGRLEENKGFHVAARALGLLLRREGSIGDGGSTPSHTPRGWRWVLIGDGPYRSTIERVAAEEGLGSRMIVAGRASEADLHAWYETATLFVHPTLYEGSSLVTLEAMAHEKPVVATRAGGLPDKVFPGVNGWLVEPDRVDQLADALAEAMAAAMAEATPGAGLARMGRASRAIVAREFAWPAVAARLMALYRQIGAAG